MNDQTTATPEIVEFSALETPLAQAHVNAEQAESAKKKIETELLAEFPQWGDALKALTAANKAKKEAEAQYREALSQYYALHGTLPTTQYASVKPEESVTWHHSDEEIIVALIREYGEKAADYLAINEKTISPDVMDSIGIPYRIEKTVKATVSWKSLAGLVK